VIEIGYNDAAEEDRAREIVRQCLAGLTLERGVRYTADLNQSWETKTGGGEHVRVSIHDSFHLDDTVRTTTVTLGGKTRIVTADYDSTMVSNAADLAKKSLGDPTLAKALTFYSEEVVDDDRPLYGVYKAIEALTQALEPSKGAGRVALAKLVGQGKKYVDDVMETAELTRHHNDPDARLLLTEAECRNRARILIEAYAKSI
jgi:hypothetical protein